MKLLVSLAMCQLALLRSNPNEVLGTDKSVSRKNVKELIIVVS